MTPEEADKTINEYLMPNLQGKTEFKYLAPGTASVFLTPDDILTLRLLRDEFSQSWMFRNTRAGTEDRTNLNKELTLNTLNRILKQVE